MSLGRDKPEDLIDLIIAADALRRTAEGVPQSTFAPWKRLWIEPIFNLAGLGFGQLLKFLPWSLRWRADMRINQALAKGRSATSPDLTRLTSEMVNLAQRLHRET